MSKQKYNLDRFKKAQSKDYATALVEVKRGKKVNHWMWYIFPQLAGLGTSQMATYYGISGIAEARAYLGDNLLRRRLLVICEELLNLNVDDIADVMGTTDAKKLRSSMTLFEAADPDIIVFRKVLDKFYGGKRDQMTLYLLDEQR